MAKKVTTHFGDLLYKCTAWCKENGTILRFMIGDEYYIFS
jgi:hypothetical protein